MIQMLPLLPPDWGTWKWDEGNLSATTEQTQQSYQTLIEKGLCANFSRFVWNDIVDLTANALEAAGISWDSKYGSAESCKITEQMGAFMANMFNGVATNINRLGLFRWKWEINYKDQSYLGRPYVNGASTHGERADSIYAMYILELVKRLNWFLSVLKDEADFNECISTNKSNLILSPKFASIITAPSRSYETIISSDMAHGRTLRVAPHKSCVHSSNLNDAEMLARVVAAANTEALISSSIDAVSRVIYTLSVRVASMLCSESHTVLNDIPTASLSHNQKATTKTSALMEAGLRELLYRLGALSHTVARLTVPQESILRASPMIETLAPVTLSPSFAPSILLSTQASTIAPTTLDGMESNCFSLIGMSESCIDTEIGLSMMCALKDSLLSESVPNSRISTAISSSGRSSQVSRSPYVARHKITVSKSVRLLDEIIAHYTEEFRAGRGASFNISQYSNMAIAADMDAKRIAAGSYINGAESYLTNPHLIPSVCARSVAKISSRGYTDVAMEDGIPHPIGSANESASHDRSWMNTSESEKVAYSGDSISMVKASVKLKNLDKMQSFVSSGSSSTGEVSFATSLRYASIKIACNIYAVIENGAEPESGRWYAPIQNGSNLYIRQTYETPAQSGTDLNISYVFFDPIVEGTNLHIISAASLGGE